MYCYPNYTTSRNKFYYIDFATLIYFEEFPDFTATTSEVSYGTITLPAGTYAIGVQAHVGTNGSSATNYSSEIRARLNLVSGTQVAYANYYFWQSSVNQDTGVDIFNIGKTTLTGTTTIHFTAKRTGNITKVWRPALFAIRIS